MRISVLGFDHGKYDRRVVMKDIAHFVSKGYEVQYLYRESETKDFQKSILELDEKVEFVAVPKIGSGLLSRKRFEDENIKRAISFKPDYFYLHGMFVTFPISRLKKLKQFGKVIYDEHEYSPEPIAVENIFIKNIVELFIKLRDKLVSRYIDTSFTVSKSIMEYMLSEGYQKIYLKPNVSEQKPIIPIEFSKRSEVLIVAGGLQIERGPFKILDVFRELNKENTQLELHLHVNFGSKDLEYTVLAYIKKYNMSNVKIFPLIPYADLVHKISNSLAVFMAFPTGIWKTNFIAMPNRFYDALVAGTPIIASYDSIDVSNETLENNLGVSFDFHKFDISINDLNDFITNETRYNNSLSSIYDYAYKNSWDEVLKVLDEVFI